jgi:hypothetical protein
VLRQNSDSGVAAGYGGAGARAMLTYRECADGVDSELVDLFKRHDGQIDNG